MSKSCHRTTPCPTCPWRKSSPAGGSAIPGFNLDLMRGLSNTVGQGDDLRPIMACHYSEPGEETTCIGYAAVEGYSNINVRLLATKGRIDLRGIWEACEGLDLWGSFEEMLEAYEQATGKPDYEDL